MIININLFDYLLTNKNEYNMINNIINIYYKVR